MSKILVTSEFTQGFLTGMFAAEGILSISSCFEAIEPIAIDLDDYIHATDISKKLETMGDALRDTSSLIDTCKSIDETDKERAAEILEVSETQLN